MELTFLHKFELLSTPTILNYKLKIILILIMLRLLHRITYRISIRDKIKQQRQTRLGKAGETILPTKAIQNQTLIRNIGIIAHIDAGKTTTTERMLYYAGALPSPGNIDQGTTTMDYLKQQRQRGITIRSAAISFNWNKCQINLIDTPGHVDFSGEVTRSLRVLDGAVTILDGVKGVEPQTIKVWDLASKYNIPKLCFINKMDRIGSSIQRTAQAITKFLKVQPLLFQIPLGQGQNFKGVIDLLQMKQFQFQGKYGQNIKTTQVTLQHPLYEIARKKRQQLIQRIANYDQIAGELFLNQQPISNTILKAAIRRLLNNPQIHTKICPIFIGSAFKNKGVQPLLDSIVNYLPHPSQRANLVSIQQPTLKKKPVRSQSFSAFCFKIVCDRQLGPLAYTRIYSGSIKKNQTVLNSSKGILQNLGQIYRVRANQYVLLTQAVAGDIVAIGGLNQTRAGQTLTAVGDSQFVLEQLKLPSPIFTMPVQLLSKSKETQFRQSVNKLLLEDNSLECKQEVQTGQLLLSGLGELHLQVVKDKLIQQGINVKLGNLRIGYRETVALNFVRQQKIRQEHSNGNYDQFELQLQVAPLRNEQDAIEEGVKIVFAFPKVDGFETNWREFLKRKEVSKTGRKTQDQTKQSIQLQKNQVKKSIRNPTPIQPLSQGSKKSTSLVQKSLSQQQNQNQQDQQSQDEDPYYHVNTLPFDTLHELVNTCKVAMLSGSNGYPMMGVQLRILSGRFQKKHFSKSIMNRTASTIVRQILENTLLIQPLLQFSVQGQEAMIQIFTHDVQKRRGRINKQGDTSAQGIIPAASVRGWVKELRVMGLDVSMKLYGYQQIVGIDPKKLLAENI